MFLDPNIWGAKQGRRQDFGSGGGTSNKISYMNPLKSCTAMAYMNSSQVLYCNGVAKISVRGDIKQNVLEKYLFI